MYVDRCRIVEFIDILTDLVIIEISLHWSPTRALQNKVEIWKFFVPPGSKLDLILTDRE